MLAKQFLLWVAGISHVNPSYGHVND